MNCRKFVLLFWILFILIVGGFGVYSIFFSINTSIYDNETIAYEIDVRNESDSDGNMYYPTYYYMIDGKSYQCEVTKGSTKYPNKSKNKVYYESSNPENCITEYERSNDEFIGIISLIIAVVVLILLSIQIITKDKFGISIYKFFKRKNITSNSVKDNF